jgi:hypothetical protein
MIEYFPGMYPGFDPQHCKKNEEEEEEEEEAVGTTGVRNAEGICMMLKPRTQVHYCHLKRQ